MIESLTCGFNYFNISKLVYPFNSGVYLVFKVSFYGNFLVFLFLSSIFVLGGYFFGILVLEFG
jgi:hypothetical protein